MEMVTNVVSLFLYQATSATRLLFSSETDDWPEIICLFYSSLILIVILDILLHYPLAEKAMLIELCFSSVASYQAVMNEYYLASGGQTTFNSLLS